MACDDELGIRSMEVNYCHDYFFYVHEDLVLAFEWVMDGVVVG